MTKRQRGLSTKIIAANAAYLALVVSALSIDGALVLVKTHYYLLLAVTIIVEAVIVAGALKLTPVENFSGTGAFSVVPLKKTRTKIRFADSDDLPGCVRVYDENFDPNMTMKYEYFSSLMDRKELVRLSEDTFLSGKDALSSYPVITPYFH